MRCETLPHRLRKIAELIGTADTVADVGCDHGLLGAALLEDGRAKKVIASDISIASLQKARFLAEGRGLSGRMEFREGNGLSVLAPGEADVIVLAGMGGMLMADILRNGDETAKAAGKLVLLPHRNVYELRGFLCGNGYEIVTEGLAREQGRYYNVMHVQAGQSPPTGDFWLRVGNKLLENGDPLLRGYLEQEVKTTKSILHRAVQGKDTGDYCDSLVEDIRKMEDLLKCL